MNTYQPFLAVLTIGSSYIQPKSAPTLDGLLWGAVRLESPECEDVADLIPLQKTDGVFHGSCMMCDPLFKEQSIQYFQSINTERNENSIPAAWMDTRLYKGSSIDISRLRSGDSGRETFSTKMDMYTLYARGLIWKAGFFGCGDLSRVESLLRVLPGIGRKAARGYGAIVDVDVAPVDQDLSLTRDGKPMRPIPEKLWEKLGGAQRPLKKARAIIHTGHPDDYEVMCVAPTGERLPW